MCFVLKWSVVDRERNIRVSGWIEYCICGFSWVLDYIIFIEVGGD